MTALMFENILNTATLLVVFVACALHIAGNITHASAECERWGFILTGAGSFGTVITIWWPRWEWQQFSWETTMHLGMAMIACWLVSGKIRAFMVASGFHWAERRRT